LAFNLYAEYTCAWEDIVVFNVNVDNVFNRATATGYFPFRNLSNLTVTEDMILSGNWQLDESVGMSPTTFGMAGCSFLRSRPAGMRFSF
jgi:hypothetical protein